MATNLKRLMDVQRRTGLVAPILRQGAVRQHRPSPFLSDEENQLDRQIHNYQTRFGAIGLETPEPEQKTNLLIRVLQNLDRPRNAVMVGFRDLINTYDFGEAAKGFMRGLRMEDTYRGSDFLKDMGVQNRFARGVGGFVTDVLTDPLTYATFGAGSFGKGLLTGSKKTLSQEGAEQMTRGLLRMVGVSTNPKAMKETAKQVLQRMGREATESSIDQMARRLVQIRAGKAGLRTLPAGQFSSVDDMLRATLRSGVDQMLQRNAQMAGRGVSVLGRTVGDLTGARMQDLGASVSQAITRNTGAFGRGIEAIRGNLGKLFSPTYVQGLDSSGRHAMRAIVDRAMGKKHLADYQLTQKAGRMYDNLVDMFGRQKAQEYDRALTKLIEGTIRPNELGDAEQALTAMARVLQRDLKEWGFKELDAGVLTNMLKEGYVPHVKNWDLARKGKVNLGGATERLKTVNYNAFKRKYGDTIEQANQIYQFYNSSQHTREAFLRNLFRTSSDDAVKAVQGKLKNINLSDISTELPSDTLRTILRNLDGEKAFSILDGPASFFEESFLKSYISRGLRHNKIIADKEIIDGVLEGFGQRISGAQAAKRAMREGKDVVVSKSHLNIYGIDPRDAADLRRFATLNRDMAGRRFSVKQAAKRMANEEQAFARMSGKTAAQEARDLLRRHQVMPYPPEVQRIIKRIKQETNEAFARISPEEYIKLAKYNIAEAYALPKGVINHVNFVTRRQTEFGLGALGEALDTFHRIWKPMVTGYRPDYYIRNFFGDSFNTYLNHGLRGLDPKIQATAMKLARGKNLNQKVTLGGKTYTLAQIKDEYIRHHINANFFRADPQDLARHMADSAMMKTATSAKDRLFNLHTGMVRHVGGSAEDYLRYTDFLVGLDRGFDFTQAAQLAKIFHFDYSDLTAFERHIMKRIVPFYTWARKNIPLQLENFFNQPGKYKAVEHLIQNLENAYDIDSQHLPEWMVRNRAMPMPFLPQTERGKTPYFNVALPLTDLARRPEDFLGMLTPAIKAPIEMITNRQMGTGAPIYRHPEERLTKTLEYLMKQTGGFRNFAEAMMPSDPDEYQGRPNVPYLREAPLPLRAIRILQDYDTEAGRIRDKYNYTRRLGNRVSYLKSQGYPIPDVRQAEKYSKLPPYMLEVMQRTGLIPPVLR